VSSKRGNSTLCLCDPRGHIGAARVSTSPGARTWNDLVAPDPGEAPPFYGDC
jgi:hypothetical protein